MRFTYLQIGPRDFAPIIPIHLKGATGWLAFEAYVDSGASFSIFHSSRAKILGLNYRNGRRLGVTVGGGKQIEVHLLELLVSLGVAKFKAVIGFSDELGVKFNLLGRASFFDRYTVCFNDSRRFIDFS